MKKLLLSATAALSMTAAVSGVTAQQPRSSDSSIVTVGCVAQAIPDGSLSGSPGVPPSTPATAPILANAGQPTGSFVLSGATPADASAEVRAEAAAGRPPAAATSLTTYALGGSPSEVARHVGHWVEVTGNLTVASAGGEESIKTPVKHLTPVVIRMIASKCPRSDEPR